MSKTKIEWTNNSWNPIRARNLETGGVGHFCEKVSLGCANCYSARMQKRFRNKIRFNAADRNKVELFLDGKTLTAPLRWRKPSMIFVCSMTDLFADFVSDEWIDKIFAVMALCPQHTFQVLTKRPERMRDYIAKRNSEWTDLGVSEYAEEIGLEFIYENGELKRHLKDAGWWFDFDYSDEGKKDGGRPYYGGKTPLPNVWLGTSVENQETADERIPYLLQTPAAVRWLSIEPLLEPMDIKGFLDPIGFQCIDPDCIHRYRRFVKQEDYEATADNDPICLDCGQVGTWTGYEQGVDWVVVGGESGPSAHPMHPQWARDLRDQCVTVGVPFFFKQWGGFIPRAVPFNDFTHYINKAPTWMDKKTKLICPDGHVPTNGSAEGKSYPMYAMYPVGKKAAGRLLDGVEWNQFPSLSTRKQEAK